MKLDIGQAREYAQAFYKATDDYLGTLSAEDLDEEIEVPGIGKNSRAYFLGIGAPILPANHAGESRRTRDGRGRASAWPLRIQHAI